LTERLPETANTGSSVYGKPGRAFVNASRI
jgi:hypothetical protein